MFNARPRSDYVSPSRQTLHRNLDIITRHKNLILLKLILKINLVLFCNAILTSCCERSLAVKNYESC